MEFFIIICLILFIIFVIYYKLLRVKKKKDIVDIYNETKPLFDNEEDLNKVIGQIAKESGKEFGIDVDKCETKYQDFKPFKSDFDRKDRKPKYFLKKIGDKFFLMAKVDTLNSFEHVQQLLDLVDPNIDKEEFVSFDFSTSEKIQQGKSGKYFLKKEGKLFVLMYRETFPLCLEDAVRIKDVFKRSSNQIELESDI